MRTTFTAPVPMSSDRFVVERRQHARRRVPQLTARVRLGDAVVVASVRDMSQGGLLLDGDIDVDAGVVLAIELVHPQLHTTARAMGVALGQRAGGLAVALRTLEPSASQALLALASTSAPGTPGGPAVLPSSPVVDGYASPQRQIADLQRQVLLRDREIAQLREAAAAQARVRATLEELVGKLERELERKTEAHPTFDVEQARNDVATLERITERFKNALPR